MEYDSGVWPPFRINERKIQPGDLTKQLSLPWQSDFGQCNTIWYVPFLIHIFLNKKSN